MKPHKHAALMAEYAKDAAETETPWERWEYQFSDDGKWNKIEHHPSWIEQFHYRRKTRTIRIGGFDVPEPVRKPLERGQKYWIASTWEGSGCIYRWSNDTFDLQWLAAGLIHLTEEAAELHVRALLSFTKKEEP